ncbi:MAG: ATP-binding protein [Bacteroidota bacterium]
MKVSLQELEKLMQLPSEDNCLEFKEAKTQFDFDKTLQYCVALANEGGGKFVLGITNKRPRKIIGTSAFQNPVKTASQIYNKLHFRVDIDTIAHPDGRVLVFEIPTRPKGTAYQYEGRYLMRSGEELVLMSEDHLRKIFDEGKPDFLSELALENLSPQDVVQLLDTQAFFDLLEMPYPSTRDSVLHRFETESLIVKKEENYSISNLGAILFAKSLTKFPTVSRKAVRVVVYQGKNKIDTKLDRIEDKGYAAAFEGFIDFIEDQTPVNEVLNTALREEVKMYPKIAIRELVGNALIHQDFAETGASVVIEIFSNRIEITNPGLPFIPPERFIDEYQSRNEKMADILRRCRICEEKGSGIDKVIINIEAFQLPALDFRIKSHQTTAFLFAPILFDKMDRSDRIRACYQHCGLKYVNNEKMTNESLRKRFHLKSSQSETASRIIKDTLNEGLIKLDDPTNTSKRYAKYVPFWE